MARRTFMLAFSGSGKAFIGRWRQQARLLPRLRSAQRKSVTEVAIAVGYDSVSASLNVSTMLDHTTDIFRAAFLDTR